MTVYLMPYKETSQGAEYFIHHNGFTYMHPDNVHLAKRGDIVINWGCGWPVGTWRRTWLNNPVGVARSVNKLDAYMCMKQAGVSIPPYCTHHAHIGRDWFETGVLCRTELEGKMGQGITVAKTIAQVKQAPLYVKHVGHTDEYRIHVFRGDVINAGIKVPDSPDANKLIRNYKAGQWLFENVRVTRVPRPVLEEAVLAVDALGLDFAAVDVGIKGDTAWVFETNTAPGSGHYTFTRFSEAFKEFINNLE